MVFVEFTNEHKTKLALVEKPEAFLERMCSDVRKEIQVEIGKLFFFAGNILFRILEKFFVTCTLYLSMSLCDIRHIRL